MSISLNDLPLAQLALWMQDNLLADPGNGLLIPGSYVAPGDIARGTHTMTWPGGSPLSNQQIVAHGLGVVPTWWCVWGNGLAPGPAGWHAWSQDAVDNVHLKFYGISLNGTSNISAGTAGTAYWIAIK